MSSSSVDLNQYDSVVRAVVGGFLSRADFGKEKYGQTMDRQDLSVVDWVRHAREELMDATLYLQKLEQVLGEGGGSAAGAAGAPVAAPAAATTKNITEEDEFRQVMNEPLVNDRGEPVDRNNYDGVKLNYKRATEYFFRKATEEQRARDAEYQKEIHGPLLDDSGAYIDPTTPEGADLFRARKARLLAQKEKEDSERDAAMHQKTQAAVASLRGW